MAGLAEHTPGDMHVFPLRSAFADDFEYKGQPVIIGEYDGIAIETDIPGWGYGNKIKKEEFMGISMP